MPFDFAQNELFSKFEFWATDQPCVKGSSEIQASKYIFSHLILMNQRLLSFSPVFQQEMQRVENWIDRNSTEENSESNFKTGFKLDKPDAKKSSNI